MTSGVTGPAGERGHLVGWDRPSQKEPLALVASERRKLPELAVRLDALADDRHPKGVGHGDDGINDLTAPVVAGYLLDEAAVDLQDVHVQALQVGERRVPGPEVVQGEEHPELGQRRQGRSRVAELTNDCRLGDLQAELGRHDTVFVDGGGDAVDQRQVRKLLP